ncbi:MAG: hypothetical protein KDK55_06130 [Chlamydiia bacterium]|nr:hypothetical protein [Chlamydiia bacterium]
MVGPIGQNESRAPEHETQDDNARQALQILNVLEVYSFFLEQDKEHALKAVDASSLQSELKKTEEEVEEGKITPSQASNKILSLIREYEKKQGSSLPSFDLTHPKDYAMRVADQVFAFQAFVKGMAEREGDILANGKELAQTLEKLGINVTNGHLSYEEGLAQLLGHIQSTYPDLPPSMRYPLPITNAYM